MKTKTYQVFEFKELSKEAKAYAIDKHYEYEDYPWLADDLTEILRDLAPYWEEAKLQYSLSCCQGDGLSFSGKLNLKKFLDEKMPKLRRKGVMLEYIYKIFSTGNKGHYSYAAKNQIELDYNYSLGKEHKRLDKIADEILEAVKDDYMEVCGKLEEEGYGILEYRMTEEEFQEHCEANDYDFLENGRID